jgi:hypothetical protein
MNLKKESNPKKRIGRWNFKDNNKKTEKEKKIT